MKENLKKGHCSSFAAIGQTVAKDCLGWVPDSCFCIKDLKMVRCLVQEYTGGSRFNRRTVLLSDEGV